MGQYFRAVNPDRKEFVALNSGMKVFERVTNAGAMTMLGLLLVEHDAPEEYYDYYGRWAGDDVRLVGDYADGDLYSAPEPTIEVAPLSNPHLIQYDKETTTAPDRHAVTEDVRYEYQGSPIPILKGSWTLSRCECKHPSGDHPDSELTVGTYVRMRSSNYDELEDDTYGVVMTIDNDWTDVTEGIEREAKLLSEDDIEQEPSLQPFHVIEA